LEVRDLTVADTLVEGLLGKGIDTIYTLPGVQNDPFFDALYAARSRMRTIHGRHEQGAGYMALGAALATGRPQAMCVVPGPGLLNTAAALATGYATNAPLFTLVGQIPSQQIGRMYGILHETPDQPAVLRALTKWSARVEDPAKVAGLFDTAFRTMTANRPRPVALEVPMDVWRQKVVAAAHPATGDAVPEAVPEIDLDAARAAARLLGSARRPLIVVGGGAVAARDEVRELAETLDAPVLAFRMGKGVLDSRHRLSANLPEGHKFWAEADVVLAIGTRLQLPLMSWGTDSNLQIIRLDIDPEEIGRHGKPAVGMIGDAAPMLRAIAAALPAHNSIRPGRSDEIATTKAAVARVLAEKLAPQLEFLRVIREELPDDGVLVEDLTQLGYVARFSFPAYRPRTFLSSGYQGTLGWSFASGLGAQVARPDTRVVSISGDGGFMFTVQELATAVHFRIPIVAIVFNDNAYGNVRLLQRQNFGGREIANELTNPDFVRMAESFGALGLRAGTPAALRDALRRAFRENGPTVIEVPVGELPSPWEFFFLPRVRGSLPG
jgi:acetolactate synthase-1/2/3 large subunit